MASPKHTRRSLKAAMASDKLVVVSRRSRFADRRNGFVVGVGSKWMLLRSIDEAGAADGYVAFRVDDIRSLKKEKTFAARAARAYPDWPPVAPPNEFNLDTTIGVLQSFSAAANGGLIGIEKERERYAQWIGTFDEIIGKWVYLLEVRPDGSWHKKPRGYRLRAITSVSAGDRYQTALAKFVDWSPPTG